jgi:hypothetical protein
MPVEAGAEPVATTRSGSTALYLHRSSSFSGFPFITYCLIIGKDWACQQLISIALHRSMSLRPGATAVLFSQMTLQESCHPEGRYEVRGKRGFQPRSSILGPRSCLVFSTALMIISAYRIDAPRLDRTRRWPSAPRRLRSSGSESIFFTPSRSSSALRTGMPAPTSSRRVFSSLKSSMEGP